MSSISTEPVCMHCRLISFVEFQAFEALLCLPDSVYVLAFQLFDTNSSGFVTYGEQRYKMVLSLLDTYAKEIMFLSWSVCLSVCLSAGLLSKVIHEFLWNFLQQVGLKLRLSGGIEMCILILWLLLLF